MESHGKEFYLSCKPVFNQSAETTELWFVYDGSARDSYKASSMNEFLQAYPPLQNQLWKVLVRGRFHLVA